MAHFVIAVLASLLLALVVLLTRGALRGDFRRKGD